ncbi:MAG: hypothetical protein ACP5T5_05135 [Thermoprotei archaeon]|nr:hypothetical protein [TACK group archaeon]
MEHRIERRMRVKKNDSVKEGQAKINPQTATQLKIVDSLEVVVAGKRKLVLKALTGADVPASEIWACPDDMTKSGVADNSIATIRAYSGS